MRINRDRHVQTDKPWINWSKDGKRGKRLINWRGKSCFSHTNPGLVSAAVAIAPFRYTAEKSRVTKF